MNAEELFDSIKETNRVYLAAYSTGYAAGIKYVLDRLERKFPKQAIACERCEQLDQVHDQNCPNHPDYDPTPWCSYCGARKESDCHCGPIAENN